MIRRLALATALTLAASRAAGGETACWLDGGVVVVPAEIAGVAGDFILDTATPRTELAESQARAAGLEGDTLLATVRVAGLTVDDAPVAVADLDMRTGALPTPIAGVIGADLLRGHVLDVSFAPCRIAIRDPGGAPALPRAAKLPLMWVAGRPTVAAQVSDGAHILAGAFAVGVGADRAVRLSDAVADVAGAAKRDELYPYGALVPRLHALAIAGAVTSDLPAGLMAAEDPALIGQIGAPFLARYRLRFDVPAGVLLLAPASPR